MFEIEKRWVQFAAQTFKWSLKGIVSSLEMELKDMAARITADHSFSLAAIEFIIPRRKKFYGILQRLFED